MDIKTLFKKTKDLIKQHITNVDIEHVGGSSIPGALTKGDLDISVCTKQEDFNSAVIVCKKLFQPVYVEDLWNEYFAVFQDKSTEIKIDIMVVIKESPFDTFTKTRDFLSQNKESLNEYNEIKKHYNKVDYKEYLRMKKEFFNKIGKEKLNILS